VQHVGGFLQRTDLRDLRIGLVQLAARLSRVAGHLFQRCVRLQHAPHLGLVRQRTRPV
jgi:hypothetical protein